MRICKRLKIILLVMVVLVVFSCPLAQGTTESELREKIKEADERIAQAEEDLKKAKEDKASAEQQKEIIDGKIEAIVANLVYLNTEIETANAQIAEKEKEKQEAEETLAANIGYFKKRVVSMYKSGTSTYLEMLFTADDINDFFNRMDMLQYVVTNDKKIVDEMTVARDTVIEAKKVIEERKAELEDAYALAEEQKAELDTALAEQQVIINQLDEDVKESEQAAADAQKEKDEFNKQLEEELARLAEPPPPPENKTAYTGGKMAWPVPDGGTITSRFGYRTYPAVGMHTGLDIAIGMGHSIIAAESGTVLKVVHGTTGYGKYLMINHGNGTVTLYGHTSKIVVSQGQYVEKGQKIAEIGSTGFSTGPHLHFEVRLGGKAVNPIGYIT